MQLEETFSQYAEHLENQELAIMSSSQPRPHIKLVAKATAMVLLAVADVVVKQLPAGQKRPRKSIKRAYKRKSQKVVVYYYRSTDLLYGICPGRSEGVLPHPCSHNPKNA